MTLDELRPTIFSPSPFDWHVMPCGRGSGPAYLDAFQDITEGDQERLAHDSHMYRATFKPDVSLTLGWGLRWGSDDDEPFTPDWVRDRARPVLP